MDEKELIERMLRESEEFKNLFQQHKKCEKELEEFKNKNFLTEDEKLKEKELKKKKLALKDKMYFLMREYKNSHP